MEDTQALTAKLGPNSPGMRWARIEHKGRVGYVEVPADDDRPVMTESELSFHTTVAGIRAREAAADAVPAEAKLALGQLAAADRRGGTIIVAGEEIHPVSIATLWAYDDCSKLLGDPLTVSIYAQHALSWLLLHEPAAALDFGIRGDRDGLIAKLAAIAGRVDPQLANTLDDWFLHELGRIRTLAGGSSNEGAGEALGKPQPESSGFKNAEEPPPDGL